MIEVKAIDCFVDSDFSHYKVWDEVSLQNRDFYLYEYEDIPRGRVVYDVKSEKYIVYSNRNIITSSKAKALIINGFDLETDDVLFNYDEHYTII